MKGGSRRQVGLDLRNCVACGAEFQPYRDFQVSCGKRPCRDRARGQSPRLTEHELVCKRCDEPFKTMWSGIGRPPPCPDCAELIAEQKNDRRNVARRVSVNPDRREVNLRQNLRQYGITPERYHQMVDAQQNRCAVCGAEPNPNGVKASSRLHVDHDHVTGLIRELLCTRCNQGVGYFRDDPTLLREMANYIERHRNDVLRCPGTVFGDNRIQHICDNGMDAHDFMPGCNPAVARVKPGRL